MKPVKLPFIAVIPFIKNDEDMMLVGRVDYGNPNCIACHKGTSFPLMGKNCLVEHAASLLPKLDQRSERASCTFY